jgi:hypothetical protein
MPKTLLLTGTVSLAAARKGPPRASILAYSGATMRVAGWGRVVVDLAGLSVPEQVPLLADHRAELSGIIGHARPTIAAGQLLAEGTVSEATEAARQVVALAKEGLSWQASVGLDVSASKPVKANTPITVNGRTITEAAPFTLITASVLKEITVTALAADGDTTVSIAAMRRGKDTAMTFEQWLQSNGWDSETLTEAQKTSLTAAYDAQNASSPVTAAEDMRAEAARLAGIRAACVDHPAIEARAITENWTVADTELHVLRARRPTPPAGHRGNVAPTGNVLEAALCLHLGAADVAERQYDERTVQAARDMRIRHVMDLVEHSLRANHIEPRGGPQEILRASWSTNTIGGILSNVANKVLLDQYRMFPSIAKRVSKKLSAANFKEHTGFRLTGANTLLEEVGSAGEIKHGSLAEASYTYRIATYAKMFGLTRQDIINDDLGALNEVPRLIARGAALKLESLFWTLVLANTGSFFSQANGNYFGGADSALSAESLGTAVKMLRSMTDAEGEPVMLTPKSLVVPPELEAVADALYSSLNIVVAGQTDVSTPDGNIFAGKYKPETVPHLSNTSYSGYSSTAWYLFCDPADTPAFGVSFLNNVEFPTIETGDTDFNKLGVQFRGYHDFGVCQIDTKGAIKSKGTE